MSRPGNFFDRTLDLFTNVLYQDITKYPTFTHLKSFFGDCWYNFLIPTVLATDFDWDAAANIIESEAKNKVDVSYYIVSDLLAEYKPLLTQKGHSQIGSEVYMAKSLTEVHPDIKCNYKVVDDSTIDLFVKMDQECFPEWESTEKYSRYFNKLSQTTSEPIIYNLLASNESDHVGFGCVVISQKLGLSYLHNTGVLNPFRRQGYYPDLAHYRCNKSLELGAKDIFAIVEEDGGSFRSLQRLGFHPEVTYYIFSGSSSLVS